MPIIQVPLPHLKCLSISGLISGSMQNCSFANLVILQVDGCWLSGDAWTLFLTQNPQLKELRLNHFVLVEDSLIAICNMVNLSYLHLRFGLYPVTLVTRVLERCKDLKTLALTSITHQQFANLLQGELQFKVIQIKYLI